VLPRDGTVIGIDLAEDKQAIAVIDHEVRVLARKATTGDPRSRLSCPAFSGLANLRLSYAVAFIPCTRPWPLAGSGIQVRSGDASAIPAAA